MDDLSTEAAEAARRAHEWAVKVDGETSGTGRDMARARARLWALVAQACTAVAAASSPLAVQAAERALDAARRQEGSWHAGLRRHRRRVAATGGGRVVRGARERGARPWVTGRGVTAAVVRAEHGQAGAPPRVQGCSSPRAARSQSREPVARTASASSLAVSVVSRPRLLSIQRWAFS